jgi:hypothetical protein
MKRILICLALFLAGALIGFEIAWLLGFVRGGTSLRTESGVSAQEEVISFSATIDGSERFVFTPGLVRHEHGQWSGPVNVVFHGVPWDDLSQSPQGWPDLAQDLNLRHARIVAREGRDVVALELTPEGFDLLFADTQMGAGNYVVTIAIPRK